MKGETSMDQRQKISKVALLIAYRGSDFHGFQAQGDLPTVELRLREILWRSLQIRPRQWVPAGRTDAGVHALGQVVSLRAPITVPVKRWPSLINAQARKGIWLRAALPVAPTFHARARALQRSYRYLICEQAGDRDPAWAWGISAPLDLQAMQSAAQQFLGEHDFLAFAYRHILGKSTRCQIHQVRIKRRGSLLQIDVTGSRFLRRMVRLMVAQLVEVGLGWQGGASVTAALASGKPTLQGPMAPARGLYLREVRYAREDFVSAMSDASEGLCSRSATALSSATVSEIWALTRRN